MNINTIPIAKMSDVTRDIWRSPVQDAVLEAGRKLLSLKMARIAGVPDEHDCARLRDDFDVLCDIIDPVILAMGEYAQGWLGFSADKVRDHFTDVLRNALEADAIPILDRAAEQIVEDRMEDAQ